MEMEGDGEGLWFSLAPLRLCVPFFKPSLLSLYVRVSIFMGESQVRAFR